MKLRYHYIYFNANYGEKWKIDPNEYNAICLRDAALMDDVDVIQCGMDHLPEIFRKMYAIHTSTRINNIIKLPLKRIWYPFFFKEDKRNHKPFCFIVAGTNLSLDYLKYLKRKYPNSKFVKLHRDLMKVTYQNPEYSEENMSRIFDLRLTYDSKEADKYGIGFFTEIESKIDVLKDENYPISDVFFAGKAKDRLPKIIAAYDVLEKAGLRCDFYVTGVLQKDRLKREGIKYADSLMPYKEMLYRSVNAKCILDINQEGAVGYTSRFLEAVIYNKKLIADNPTMLQSKYYNPKYIQYINDFNRINTDFVKDEAVIDYHYTDDFSPVHLIYQIDNELHKLSEVE